MSVFEVSATIGLVIVVLVAIYIVAKPVETGNVFIAAVLSAAFGGYTAVTIYADGFMPIWSNHTNNLWGVQVWWDLLFAVALCLFLAAPRARKVGMNLPLWTVFVVGTASIGLLAMLARLFWLENQAQSAD